MLNPVQKGCQWFLYPVKEVKKDVRVLRREGGTDVNMSKEESEGCLHPVKK
jgi:hypothetical protein